MIHRLMLIALLALPGTALAAGATRGAPESSVAAEMGQRHPLAISPSMVGPSEGEGDAVGAHGSAPAAAVASPVTPTAQSPVTPSVGATNGRPEVEGPSGSSPTAAKVSAVTSSALTPSNPSVGAHGDAPVAESRTSSASSATSATDASRASSVGAHGNAPVAETRTSSAPSAASATDASRASSVGAHGNAPVAESSTTTEPTPTVEASAEATDGMDADDATYADLPTAVPAELKQLDNTIARHRTPFEVLTERMIGEASRAVRFDWRRKTVGVGAIGSQLLELNNFWSARVGGFARVPFSSLVTEVAVTWVFTRGSESTERLALTPYRQVGRPSRLELDVNVGFPVAEGVATAWPSFLPPLELVFSLDVGFRYIYYPGALSGAGFREVAGAIFSPQLNDRELENLEEDRLPAMEVDGGRYNLLAGGSLDLYFQSGFFLSPRVMVALPIMSQFTGSGLGWWWELSLGLGWMF